MQTHSNYNEKNNGDSTQYLIKWIENNKEECNWVDSTKLFFYKKLIDDFQKRNQTQALPEEIKVKKFKITHMWIENGKYICGGEINGHFYKCSRDDVKKYNIKSLLDFYESHIEIKEPKE